MRLREYHYAESIAEVVELLDKSKKNIILGGNHWLKLGDGHYNKGIDISGLGLDYINELEDVIEIGADVSLRDIETNLTLQTFAGILCQSVGHIVGVQFRNTARIGATVFARYGFSDVVAALLTLDTEVEINGLERMELTEYVKLPRRKHFVTKIIIRKEQLKFSYQAMRKSKTDFAYMILAMSVNENNDYRIVTGARPRAAIQACKTMAFLNTGTDDIEQASEILIEEAGYSANCYAGQAYRQHLAKVFFERGIQSLWK